MTDESGTEIGKYRLIAKLGQGGMGAVYVAEHMMMGKRVAVKVLRPDAAASADLTARFINEARAAARILHPGIVEVFDCGLDEKGRAYMAMELLRGQSLGALVRRQKSLAAHPALIRRLGRDTALAVGAAHAAEIVHRDLKPDNLFLAAHHEGPSAAELKVLDFGIAKLSSAIIGPDAQSTQSGAFMGTALYMSPEQCIGAKTVDHRTDIYSLGCIIFELTAGRTPFADLGVGAAIAAHLTETPPRLRDLVPDVDDQLEALVTRMLAKNPADRPSSMTAVAAALASGLPPAALSGPIALPAGIVLPTDVPGAPRAVDPALGSYSTIRPEAPVAGAPPVTLPQTTLSSSARAVDAPRNDGPRRRSPAVIAAVSAAAIVGAVIVVRAGVFRSHDESARPTLQPATTVLEDTVNLDVTGVPAAGRALLDGKPITLPLRLARGAVDHELLIEAPGFEPFVQKIRAERDLQVAVALKPMASPAPAPAPIPKAARPGRKPSGPAKPSKSLPVPDIENKGEGARRAREMIQDL